MTGHLWWYVARAGGLVALALLAASVLWGLALSTRVLGPKPRPSWLLDLHRFLGGAAVIFTGIHVLAIVLDTYVHFGLAEVLVPLASAWKPGPVAWGIVALYLLLAVEVTSLLRRHLSKRVWRTTHLLSFPLFASAVGHGITAGTDGRNAVVRVLGLTAAVVVAGLTAYRIDLARRRPRPPGPGPRRYPRLSELPPDPRPVEHPPLHV